MRRRTKSMNSGYSRYAGGAAAALTLVLAVRLHELFPQLNPLRPGLLAIVASVGLVATTTPFERFREAWRTPPSKWLAGWVLLGVLTVPFAYYGVAAFEGAQALVYGALIFIAYLVTQPTITNYRRLSAWLFACTVVYGIRTLMLGVELENGRLTSAGGFDPNDLAALVVLALPFGLALVLRSKEQWKRVAAVAGVLVLLVVLIRTASRGGFLALGVSSLVYVSGFRGGKRVRAMMVAVMVGLVAVQFMDANVRARVATIFSIGGDYNLEDDEDGRIAVWARGISYAFDRPLTGVGANNFEEADGRWRRSINNAGKWSAAHNAFIQVLAELGFPGAIAFVAFGIGLFKTALRTWRLPTRAVSSSLHQPELLAALTSFSVTAMFLSHGYHHALFALGGLTILGVRAAGAEYRASQAPGRRTGPLRRGQPRRVQSASAAYAARYGAS